MKRLLPFFPLVLLAALLLSPAAAVAGAREGLSLWWGSVFPALLPSFLCVRLAEQLGLLRLAGGRPRGQLLAAVGFALISGAPNGAKLLSALVREGILSAREGERLLPLVNSVSPVFLISIIASELLKNKALFLPMAAAYYGCILVLLLPALLRPRERFAANDAASEARPPFAEALSRSIGGSMMDMLSIGGCIFYACTLLSMMRSLVSNEGLRAALAGLMEVSTGAAAVAGLSLPLRLKVSLLTGAAAFGGLSLGLQTACCYPEVRLIPCLIKKLLLGLTVGGVCFLLFPLFPEVSAAFASRQEVVR